MPMSVVAMLVGAFGVFAGWHWKLLHRGFQTVTRARGELAAARRARFQHLGRAVLFAIAAVVILILLVKG
jgi:hypothetical protein